MNEKYISDRTVAGKFKRLRYFHGMLLTEDDFLEEQYYYREKLKLHNRLHGSGIVRGLKLSVLDSIKVSEDDTHAIVFIEPGFALDCEGNEVVVCKRYEVNLDKYIDQLKRSCRLITMNEGYGREICEEIDQTPRLYIGLLYDECLAQPSQQYVTICGEDQHQQFSRLKEGFRVVVFPDDEWPLEFPQNHAQDKSCCSKTCDCPGVDPCCENDRIIILGSVEISTRCETDYYDIIPEKIDMTERACRAWVAPCIEENWNEARQRLLNLSPYKNEINDISQVVGLPRHVAQRVLEQKFDLTVHSQSLKPSTLTPKDLAEVRTVSPFVSRGTKVCLVTDDVDERVLFVLPRETAPQERPIPPKRKPPSTSKRDRKQK